MRGEKLLTGIKLLGMLGIIFSIIVLLAAAADIFLVKTKIDHMITTILYIAGFLSYFIFSIAVLKLKNWARIGLVLLGIIYTVDTLIPPGFMNLIFLKRHPVFFLITITGLMFFCSTVFYFTRSRVKEQFRK